MSETPKLTRAQRDARYRALPIALIQRPLRLIRERTNIKETDPITKVVTFHESLQSRVARRAAAKGQGNIVKHFARSL